MPAEEGEKTRFSQRILPKGIRRFFYFLLGVKLLAKLGADGPGGLSACGGTTRMTVFVRSLEITPCRPRKPLIRSIRLV